MKLRDLFDKLRALDVNAGARGKSLLDLPVVVNDDDGGEYDVAGVSAAEGDDARIVLWIEDRFQ